MEAINSTAIFVDWRPPETQRENGIIRGYQVYCVVVDSKNRPKDGTDRIFDTTDGNRREAVITGLEPDTRYSIKVAGYTRRGDGQRSRERFITTTGAGMSYLNLIQCLYSKSLFDWRCIGNQEYDQ